MRRMVPVVGGCLVLIASSVAAQATVTGLVRDSAGHPIVGAEVAIEALNRTTHADETGHFLLGDVTPGMRLLRVRRVGYSPFSRMTQVLEGENKQSDIVLGRVITKLDTVITRDQMLLREDPLLWEFEENRKMGLGHFITRAELAKQEGRKMANILEQLPGIAIKLDPFNPNVAYVESGRRTGCFAQVYRDYALMSRFERLDINQFIPAQIESIEYYAGPAQTPQRYSGLGSQCGVVVLHTRRPP